MIADSASVEPASSDRAESAETCLRCKVAWDRTWNFCGECGHKKPDYVPPVAPRESLTKDTDRVGLKFLYSKSSKSKHAGKRSPKRQGGSGSQSQSDGSGSILGVSNTAGLMSRKDFENDAKRAELSDINARNTELHLHMAQSERCSAQIPTPILGADNQAKNCSTETSFASLSQSQSQPQFQFQAKATTTGTSPLHKQTGKRRLKLSASIRNANLANSKINGAESPTKGAHSADISYLDTVGSVGELYSDYVAREKMFEGLKAVSTQRLDTSVSMHHNSSCNEISATASSSQSAAWFWGKDKVADEVVDVRSEDDNDEEGEEEGFRADAKAGDGSDSLDAKGWTDAGGEGTKGEEEDHKAGGKTKSKARQKVVPAATGGAAGGLGVLWSPMEAAMYQDDDSSDEEDRVSIDSVSSDEEEGESLSLSHASDAKEVGSPHSDGGSHGPSASSSRRHSATAQSQALGLGRSNSTDSVDSKHSSDILFTGPTHNYNDMIPAAFRGNKMPSSILSKHFQRSIRRIKVVLEEIFELNYARDLMQVRWILRQVTSSIESLEEAETYSKEQVDQAEGEYETIQAEIESKRRDSAMRVAQSYENITAVHAKFTAKYGRALESFEAHIAAQEEMTGLKSHMKSSAKMDRIQAAADAQLAKCGEALQLLQNNEAILLKNLRLVLLSLRFVVTSCVVLCCGVDI